METFCLGLLRAWVDAGVSPTVYLSYSGGVRENDLPVEVEKVCWNVRAKRSFLRLAKWLRTRPDDPCLALSQELVIVLLVLKKLRLIRNRIYFRESTDVEHHYGKRFKGVMRWLWPCLDGMIEQSHVGAEATSAICKGKLYNCPQYSVHVNLRNDMFCLQPCSPHLPWRVQANERLWLFG